MPPSSITALVLPMPRVEQIYTCSMESLIALMHARSYGYDPLGLGKDTATVEKYRAYELIHARWAMLAAAGIIIPEGLQVGHLLAAFLSSSTHVLCLLYVLAPLLSCITLQQGACMQVLLRMHPTVRGCRGQVFPLSNW